jgi:hypothetical protein
MLGFSRGLNLRHRGSDELLNSFSRFGYTPDLVGLKDPCYDHKVLSLDY